MNGFELYAILMHLSPVFYFQDAHDEEVSALAGEFEAELALVKVEALKLAKVAVGEGVATWTDFSAMDKENRDEIIGAANLKKASHEKLKQVLNRLLQ